MRRTVPAWLLQLVWFLAGVFATGAVWFFLSKDEYVSAWLSVGATFALVLVAVQLHRLNDRTARFRGIREALAAFAIEASALLARAFEEPLPVEAHDEWVSRVEAYLRTELDSSFAARFGNFSGMTFYGDGSTRSQFKISLDGHTQRLHEFIREFAE